MENIKAITKTKAISFTFASYGILLAICAAVNLLSTFNSIDVKNDLIDERMHAAAKLPDSQKFIEFSKLLNMQEQALIAKPSEPYAWARLSYFRTMTGASDAEAFAALRMSNTVSPSEPQQLHERAVAWLKFTGVQTKDEQDYQDILWQKAFKIEPQPTWDLAMQLGLTKTVAASLAKTDKELANGWRGRMSEVGMQN